MSDVRSYPRVGKAKRRAACRHPGYDRPISDTQCEDVDRD